MDLDQRISTLREQAAAATSRRARAEHELEFAQGRQEAALLALKTEFGIEDIEQARKALKAAEDDLAAECGRIEEALAAAGQRGPE